MLCLNSYYEFFFFFFNFRPSSGAGDVESVILKFSRIKNLNLSHKYSDDRER